MRDNVFYPHQRLTSPPRLQMNLMEAGGGWWSWPASWPPSLWMVSDTPSECSWSHWSRTWARVTSEWRAWAAFRWDCYHLPDLSDDVFMSPALSGQWLDIYKRRYYVKGVDDSTLIVFSLLLSSSIDCHYDHEWVFHDHIYYYSWGRNEWMVWLICCRSQSICPVVQWWRAWSQSLELGWSASVDHCWQQLVSCQHLTLTGDN